MTRQEVKQLMAQIRAAWPSFYRDADADTLRTAMDLWAQALEQLTARDARRALALLMRESRYPPTAADVWQAAQRLRPQLAARPAPVFHPIQERSAPHESEH